MGMSSSPILLDATSRVLRRMLAAKSPLFDVERNPLLQVVFRKTFYDQFCAGETHREIQQTIKELHQIGYHGIILECALEVVDSDVQAADKALDELASIAFWREGLLKTIDMANPGDFIGLKWSGMGAAALERLKRRQPPSSPMTNAMRAVCDAAVIKGVKLLPAAEPQYAQAEVDRWTTDLAVQYNKKTAVIYHTYQCYLKSTSTTLSNHLAKAASEGFTLGIKLVRGAYLETEQRDLLWDTKTQTDEAYDAITINLLRKEYGQGLEGLTDAFPSINLVLATHNLASVSLARKIRDGQPKETRDSLPLAYAQLQGMADEVSVELLQTHVQGEANQHHPEIPQVFKCTTWGTTKECLVRRPVTSRPL